MESGTGETAAAMTRPPAARRRWTRMRILGLVLMGLWAAAGLGALWVVVSGFDPETFAKYFPRMLSGLVVTMELVIGPIAIGMLLGLLLAWARLAGNRVVDALAFSYMYFFRGTPLLAQVFLVYYGAGQLRPQLEAWNLWWFFREAWYCVLLTFTLNTGAYQAEIYRVAIASVPKGQWEGALALGLSRRVAFLKIILPQALITALRPLGNEVILMIKGSAIASVVTILDLMGTTRLAFSRTFNFDVYLWAAVLYLIIVETMRRAWDRMEGYLTRHLKRAGDEES